MEKKLTRSRTDRTIFGVCGGIARYLNVDPTIVRLIWALVSLFSAGLGFIGYLVSALIIPDEGQD